MTKGEEDFIEEYARKLLIEWCVQTIATGSIGDSGYAGGYRVPEPISTLCITLAQQKGWIGKTDSPKVLAKGFATAAAFLRR